MDGHCSRRPWSSPSATSVDRLESSRLPGDAITISMVFNNTNTELVENNDDLKSLFFPVGPPNGTGDKRHNVVFDRANYTTVRDGLIARRKAHQEQVYCTQQWKVLPNEHYNVAGFDGLNACWFYNSSAKA